MPRSTGLGSNMPQLRTQPMLTPNRAAACQFRTSHCSEHNGATCVGLQIDLRSESAARSDPQSC
eukprot:251063-Rhodomonas_salina.1